MSEVQHANPCQLNGTAIANPFGKFQNRDLRPSPAADGQEPALRSPREAGSGVNTAGRLLPEGCCLDLILLGVAGSGCGVHTSGAAEPSGGSRELLRAELGGGESRELRDPG